MAVGRGGSFAVVRGHAFWPIAIAGSLSGVPSNSEIFSSNGDVSATAFSATRLWLSNNGRMPRFATAR